MLPLFAPAINYVKMYIRVHWDSTKVDIRAKSDTVDGVIRRIIKCYSLNGNSDN